MPGLHHALLQVVCGVVCQQIFHVRRGGYLIIRFAEGFFCERNIQRSPLIADRIHSHARSKDAHQEFVLIILFHIQERRPADFPAEGVDIGAGCRALSLLIVPDVLNLRVLLLNFLLVRLILYVLFGLFVFRTLRDFLFFFPG